MAEVQLRRVTVSLKNGEVRKFFADRVVWIAEPVQVLSVEKDQDVIAEFRAEEVLGWSDDGPVQD